MKPMRRVFSELPFPEPDLSLRSRILVCVRQRQEERLLWRRLVSGVGLTVSLLLFSGAVFQYGTSLLQSDFWSLGALLFSDGGAVLASFQDFVFSLLETLPATLLFAILAPLSLFFWSASFLLSLSKKQEVEYDYRSVPVQ